MGRRSVAEAAHQGFEAFLLRRPVRPSATQIAVSIANNRRWDASDVIVAALAERVRTRAEPFADRSSERLMAGMSSSEIQAFKITPGCRTCVSTWKAS